MIVEITNTEVLTLCKNQTKRNIVELLKEALNTYNEKIFSLQGDHLAIENYANAYKEVKTFHEEFLALGDNENIHSFVTRNITDDTLNALRCCDVDEQSIQDLRFYLNASKGSFDNTVDVYLEDATVDESKVLVMAKVCINGYMQERLADQEKFKSKKGGSRDKRDL